MSRRSAPQEKFILGGLFQFQLQIWRNKRTLDQLFNLLGLSWEFAQQEYMRGFFLGWKKKANGCVHPLSFKEALCRTVGYQGRCYVPFSFWISRLRALSVFTAQSQIRSQWAPELRQSCPLSPSLFLTFMDSVTGTGRTRSSWRTSRGNFTFCKFNGVAGMSD